MPSYAVALASNASFKASYVPVVVVTGSTAGIGQKIVQILANHLKGQIHIILVGRNKASAETTIATLPQSPTGQSKYEFMYADITLVRNIRELASMLQTKLLKINYLVHCAGVFGLGGRDDTEEGLDSRLVVRYYSRFVLTNGVLGLLRKASEMGEAASVISVLGAGMGPEIDIDDLGLRKDYSGWKAVRQSICYNDLMIAELAAREPTIAFTHIHLGEVDSGMRIFSNPILHGLTLLLYPLVWLVSTTTEECGEFMVYGLLQAEKGKVNRRNRRGDDIGMKAFPTVTAGTHAFFRC